MALVDSAVAGHMALMERLAANHAPEFLEIATTMPQAKVLYLVASAGEVHMADLVGRLGVSLSTVSGLVDRLVEAGLAARREDPADRRQVIVAATAGGRAFLERFRELNGAQLRLLLDVLDDVDLALVSSAIHLLARAAAEIVAAPDAAPRKDPA